MDAETKGLKPEKLHKLCTGKWFVHCRDEHDAYAMVHGSDSTRPWRLSTPGAKDERRNWSCPKCVEEYWNEREQRRSDTARSASTETTAAANQPADTSDEAATRVDVLKLEVAELKMEVVELKAEVERLRCEVNAGYAHVREYVTRMVRREVAAAQKPATAVDTAVPEDAEDMSHNG